MNRPRIPTEIKKKNGTYRPHRDKAPKDMPILPVLGDKPNMDNFDNNERVWFDKLWPIFDDMKVVTNSDLPEFEIMVKARTVMHLAEQELKIGGYVVITETKNGTAHQKSPWNFIYHEHNAIFEKLCAKFGMTPSDRTKVANLKPSETKKSPMQQLLESQNK